MGKTNFQTLKNLADSLSQKLNKLSNGKLNLEEIESLTEESRELYERIVIIRYKSYESVNSTSVHNIEDNSEKDKSNLIEEDAEELMMFDFSSNDDEMIRSEPDKLDKKEETQDHKIKSDNQNSLGEEKNDASLNDNFKNEDGSVAGQFEKAPIVDLKEHIGINRKFLYINELFNGDSSIYNTVIDQLNSCNSRKEALEKVNTLAGESGWDEENTTVSSFIELIERRYLG